MATNTRAFFLVPGYGEDGVGTNKRASGMHPEAPPNVIWGQGTPDGDRAPFNALNKGSIYMQTDAADDAPCVWVKVDEAGADTDWVKSGGGLHVAKSKIFNVDNGAGTTDDDIIMLAPYAVEVVYARRVFVEALGSGNAEGATTKVGTTVGGVDVVAAVALDNSQAVGSYDELTVAEGTVAANTMIAVRHTGVATTVTGQYFVEIFWH